MNKPGIFSLLVWLFFSFSCVTTKSSKTAPDKKVTYEEDISAYRAQPRPVEIAADTLLHFAEADSSALPVTDRLNTVLDTAAAYSRNSIKYIDGFTIQVYGGNDRGLAKDYQLDIIRNFPDIKSKMVFEQPNYKVRLGQYYTRLEAQAFFTEVRTVFPRAILIPTRLYIKD